MQIVVSIIPGGKQIILEVESSDSVLTVKEKIKDKEGIPSEKQQLFYSGNLLLDSDVLANHNIKTTDILVVFLRQVSDMPIPEPEKETGQLLALNFQYISDEQNTVACQEISYVPIPYVPSKTEMNCRRSVIRRPPCTIM